MDDRSQIETLVMDFFKALNSDDFGVFPFSEQVQFSGPLAQDTVGESEVREHLQQIAPFMLNVSHGKMIIDGNSVAMTSEFDGVNGVHVEGAFFLEIENGRVSRINSVFDSRPLIAGHN